jgi:phage terminase large subunit-like protein
MQIFPKNKTSLANKLADSIADGGWRSRLRKNQLAPPGDWRIWLLLAGRGFGKSLSGANWCHELIQSGKYGRIALVAPTAADARDTIVEGASGILETAPNWNRPTYEPSKRRLTWPSGSIATTFSAEEAERLRGPNHDAAWCDELCAWDDAQSVWDMLQFTLRAGSDPRVCVTTTPKPTPLLKFLVGQEGKGVVITRGSTFDNSANLAPSFLDALNARYANTRLGRQEINAEILYDMPGALWSLDNLDSTRIKEPPRDLQRIVIAVDPAVSTNEGSDETGIIVAGSDDQNHFYVLADHSGRCQPRDWARRAIDAYNHWRADCIVIEVNQGGQMARDTVRNVDLNVPIREVHASRGKVTRAEPVSALYEQKRVHHVGIFEKLEAQMTMFTSDFNRNTAGYSPDRVDALVWALTNLSTRLQVEAPIVMPYVTGQPRSFPGSARGY